jgi:hypothetical protein
MEVLTVDADGIIQPGPHESWQELADHSIEHDNMPREAVPCPV